MAKKTNLSTVAIIGRPNVGKSTLFNRLIQKRMAITSNLEGVTRDRLFYPVNWLGRAFNLIDTGGFSNNLQIDFQEEINAQVEIAIQEADLIIFLIDAKDGITKKDQFVAQKLKRIKNKKIIIAANKADNQELVIASSNFYTLGFGEVVPISSIHGIGISNLLDMIINFLPKKDDYIIDELRIGIIGKPNVGKSTLINKVLNDNRIIVSNISGTTRDAIDSKVTFNGKNYILTDSAGLKKNKKSLNDIEWYAELRTNLTILNSDIILLLIDHTQQITVMDEKIMSIIKNEYKPVIVLVNKSDIMEKDQRQELELIIKNKFKFAPWINIIFISALKGKNIAKIFKEIEKIKENLNQEIKKANLNEFLMDIQMVKKPPRHNGIEVKMSYITYLNINFPHFIIFSNHPEYIHFSYVRFIENQLRNVFDFTNIPIKISFKKKNDIY